MNRKWHQGHGVGPGLGQIFGVRAGSLRAAARGQVMAPNFFAAPSAFPLVPVAAPAFLPVTVSNNVGPSGEIVLCEWRGPSGDRRLSYMTRTQCESVRGVPRSEGGRLLVDPMMGMQGMGQMGQVGTQFFLGLGGIIAALTILPKLFRRRR